MAKTSMLRAVLAAATVAALAAGGLVLGAAPASAAFVPTDGAVAKGRATGSGKWGYVGQFGQLNMTTPSTVGQFALPYGLDVNGSTIAVTDSGWSFDTSSGMARPTVGHTTQTFGLTASPGAAGHGDYLGGGRYAIADAKADKADVVDVHDIVDGLGLKYYPQSELLRGPRGVVVADNGTVVDSRHDDSSGLRVGTTGVFTRYGSTALDSVSGQWGTTVRPENKGFAVNAVGMATDSQGNIYSADETALNVFAPDGTFLSSIGYWHNATGQSQYLSWADRAKFRDQAADPQTIARPQSVAVVDAGGTLSVYLGDSWSYYDADANVNFPGGPSTPAVGVKPASIKKYTVQRTGGTANGDFNPSAWSWTLDTSFGTGGQVTLPLPTLTRFGDRVYAGVSQNVMALHVDATTNQLFYAAANPAAIGYGSMPSRTGSALNTLDATTGAVMVGPEPLNGPAAQQDSYMGYVRGISSDARGLVYATTQNSTTVSNNRGIVQIWGKTPSPVPSANATPDLTSAVVTWGASPVGYQQPDLLDYTVKYRVAGATAWTNAPVPGGAATSTAVTRTLSGLAPSTAYEVCITPWNEAGSGDPACTTFTTKTPAPALTVVKTGNSVETATVEDALHVPADSTVAFSYVVTNTGNVPLTDVAASDDRLGPLTPPSGFTGTIPVGESVTFTASGPVAAGAYTNTVTVTTTEVPTTTDTWYGFGDTHALAIVKKGNGAQAPTEDEAIHVAADSDVTFTYEVTNTGNVPATGVTVSDDKIATLTPPAGFDGTIPAGETVVFTATGPVPAGAYVNVATTASDDVEPVTTEWHGFGETHGLTIVKTGDDTVATTADTAVHVPAGSDVTFVYTVTNVGNVPATGVTVTDDRIAALTPPAGFDGTIPAGGSVEFTASGPVTAGVYRNVATAESDVDEPATTEWNGFGDTFGLTIEKTGADQVAPTAADAVHVDAGASVLFEYTVTNTGNVPATGVTVEDDRIATLTPPQGFDGTIQPGESVVFTATGVVPAGAYVNTATTRSDDVDPVTTEWHGFGDTRTLSIVKRGADTVATTADAAVHVPADSEVSFEYTVTNTGDTTITGVTLSDDQIAELTAPSGFDGTLAPGESVVFTASGNIPAGAYVNRATATGERTASATTEWHGFGDMTGITIVKTGDGTAAPSAAEAVELAAAKDVAFEYAVTNTGNVLVHDVRVTDDKIATVAAPAGFDGTIEPGETVVFTATGPVDGAYRNVATATADDGLTAKSEWNAVVGSVVPTPTPTPTPEPPTLSVTGAAPVAPVGAAALLLLLAGGALYAFRRTRRA